MKYFNELSKVYYDGQWMSPTDMWVSPYSQSLHYGNGIFEGIRAYETEKGGTQIFKAEDHYRRFLESAKKMHLPCAYSVEKLTELSYELLERNGLRDAYIRPLLFADDSMNLNPADKTHLMLAAWEWGRYLGDTLLSVMVSSYSRPHPSSCHMEAKVSGHYVNSSLATREAKNKGFDEALLLDVNGNVAEGPGANFFYEKDGVLFTCPPGHILQGITRATVIDLAKSIGIKVVEEFFTPDRLDDADSAFFTGTAAEVAGIASVNSNSFRKEWPDTLGYRLSQKYTALTKSTMQRVTSPTV